MNPEATFDAKPIAHLARLQLSETELAEYSTQLGQILGYIAKLDSLDVSNINPTAHANPLCDVVREDVSRESLPAEALIMNAPRSAQDQISVPKVVE
jgi:aspartyl-tRNA(Asn)/glutamyl-tRNA(Gln) amidotransferase subunit C